MTLKGGCTWGRLVQDMDWVLMLVNLSIENKKAGKCHCLAHYLIAGMALAMWVLHPTQSWHLHPGCRRTDRRAKCVISAPSLILSVLEEYAA